LNLIATTPTRQAARPTTFDVMGQRQHFDLIVLGLGSAGLTAATIAARDLGLKVAAIERSRVGGDCLWSGCVPSKTLAHSAKVAHTIATAADHGVELATPAGAVDRGAVWRHMHSVRSAISLSDDNPETLAAHGVEVIFGEATITGGKEVTIRAVPGLPDSTSRVITGRFILVCTGSRPAIAAITGLSEVEYLTTDTVFDLDTPPDSLVIVGGGPVATELAQSLVRIGSQVTLIGRNPRLLPREEPELSDRLLTVLRAEGVTVHLGTEVTEIRRHRDHHVTVKAGEREVEAAAVLIATGRLPNTEALGLDRFGIPVSPAGVAVDARSRTLVPSIYAVGDVAAGRGRFTHTAAHDAAMAVRDMFFPGRGRALGSSPWCTYTDPELAHVGLTAAAAREIHPGRRVRVHRHEFSHNDRARTEGHTNGAILLVTVRGRLVGAHCLGPTAGDLIHELSMAITLGLKITDLTRFVHLYPTYSTGIVQVAAEASIARYRRLRPLLRLLRITG
jgi:pyruvate/2-oxoglutarate dehydrogenase complex dihydrolipoamide dehydrogenase (E3) component